MTNAERVRKWRTEQRRKAQLYDQVEHARREHLRRQVLDDWPVGLLGEHRGWRKTLLEAALDDPLCFDIFDKAVSR